MKINPNETKLNKWYKLNAVSFTCPHCGHWHDLLLEDYPDAPTDSEETTKCSKCDKKVEFSTEETDYE